MIRFRLKNIELNIIIFRMLNPKKSIMIFVGQTKGETETPKEEKAKGEKAKKEKTKDKKESSKSSKAKKEKVEEKDIYFIIKYQLKKREPIEELKA